MLCDRSLSYGDVGDRQSFCAQSNYLTVLSTWELQEPIERLTGHTSTFQLPLPLGPQQLFPSWSG